MPFLTEEAKRASKQEVGDLALEVVGKTIRVYVLASATKLKQLAYSDTFEGARFLFFHTPSNKMVRAKDFTVARLYKQPERARKIIARYFPTQAAAGAKAHLYYSGRGPRGLSVGTGEGYFSVSLGTGEAEQQESLMQQERIESAGFMVCEVIKKEARPAGDYSLELRRYEVSSDSKEKAEEVKYGLEDFDFGVEDVSSIKKKLGKYAITFQAADTVMRSLRDFFRSGGSELREIGFKEREPSARPVSLKGYKYKPVSRSSKEWRVKFRTKGGDDVTLWVEAIEGTTLFSDPAVVLLTFKSVKGGEEGLSGEFDVRKVSATVFGFLQDYLKRYYAKNPTGDVRAYAAGAEAKRMRIYKRYLQHVARQFPDKQLIVKVGYRLKGRDVLVLTRKKVLRLGSRSRVEAAGFTINEASIRVPMEHGSFMVEVTTEFVAEAEKVYDALTNAGIHARANGRNIVALVTALDVQSAKNIVRSALDKFTFESIEEGRRHPTRTPEKYTGPKYKRGDKVQIVRRYGFKKGKGNKASPVEPPVPGTVKQVERDTLYPKGPPTLVVEIDPNDYGRASPGVVATKYHRIRVHADEVEPMKSKGESMRTDPTFEQIARIVRRARGAGFTPGRITLNEAPIKTDNYDFIFVIHHEEDDTYQVAHSVHDDPRLGYQELETKLSRREAERMVRGLKSRWKGAKVRRFLVTGHGHKREFLPEALEEQEPSRFELQQEYDRLLLKFGHDKAKRGVERAFKISGLRVNLKGAIMAWAAESHEEKRERIVTTVDRAVQDPANKGLTLQQILRGLFKGIDEAGYTYKGKKGKQTQAWNAAFVKAAEKIKSGSTKRGEDWIHDATFMRNTGLSPEAAAKKWLATKESVDEQKFKLDWRPYPLKDGVASKAWKEVYSPEGKKLGHVVPYRYGRGWNVYAVDKRVAKGLKNKAEVEAFFLKESVDEARTWAPVWVATAKRQWRLADQKGNYLRRPEEGNVRQAYAFESAEKAFAFLKSSKGRKAVATQESLDEAKDLTFAQFKTLIGGNVFPPKKRFVLRYGGAQRDLQIIGEPDDEAARGKFVQLRPVGVLHGERDKLMPMKVAYSSFMALYRGVTPALIKKRLSEAVEEPDDEKARARRMIADTKELLQREAKIYGKKSTVYTALEKAARKIAAVHGLNYDRIKPKRRTVRENADEAGLDFKCAICKLLYHREQMAKAVWKGKKKIHVCRQCLKDGRWKPHLSQVKWFIDASRADEARPQIINKQPKEEVNYRRSEEDRDGDERCGNCAFIILPDECKRVRGKIDQDFICDLWKRGVQEGLDEVMRGDELATHLKLKKKTKMGLSGEATLKKSVTSAMGLTVEPGKVLVQTSTKKPTHVFVGDFEGNSAWFPIGKVQKYLAPLKEDLDEAAAKGKVQAALLKFIEQLPPRVEFTLADVAKRQEFRGVHFKRLMSAAKVLEMKGLIWYDGFSNVGPPK